MKQTWLYADMSIILLYSRNYYINQRGWGGREGGMDDGRREGEREGRRGGGGGSGGGRERELNT